MGSEYTLEIARQHIEKLETNLRTVLGKQWSAVAAQFDALYEAFTSDKETLCDRIYTVADALNNLSSSSAPYDQTVVFPNVIELLKIPEKLTRPAQPPSDSADYPIPYPYL